MSGVEAAGAEVLRGMQIDAVPLRLARADRGSHRDVRLPDDSAGPSAEEEALRRGFEEGVLQGHAEGLRAGYEEGRRKGLDDSKSQGRIVLEKAISEARAPLQKAQEQLRVLTASVEAALPQCLAATEDEMVALCFESIARVLGAAAVQPAAVQAQFKHLLLLAMSRQVVAMHVHPQDAELLARCNTLTEDGATSDQRLITWVPDPQISLGGCVVVAKGGGLDARIETILAGCKAALLDARAQRAARAPEDAVG
jgi:flagellar assembly protein FliH